MLEVKNVSCGYGSRIILRDISFTIVPGELVCLLGPNGVGKTTLFKTILGSLKLKSGEILVQGENITKWSQQHFAKIIGYVPQAHTPPFPFKAFDIVSMGRTPYIGLFSSPSRKDAFITEEVMRTLGILYLRDRIYTEISGGERQMVIIARALAQQPKILIMDEPTSNLDYGNQIKLLEHIKKIAEKKHIGVFMTTHHPDHVLMYASKAILLERNSKVTIGRPKKVITDEYLINAYDVEARVMEIENSCGGKIAVCIPPAYA